MNSLSSILQTNLLITVGSWEERFSLGFQKLLQYAKPSCILMFYYNEYAEWSEEYRIMAKRQCERQQITLIQKELSFKAPLSSYKTIVSNTEEFVKDSDSMTLDISTMPREALWTICRILTNKKIKVQYTYHKPNEYADDWLSRDPEKPRFIYKLAGISRLGKPTTLVILTGFDIERTKQLVRFYEPDNLVLGIQIGDQFKNTRKNREEHMSGFNRNKEIIWFDVDGFSLEYALASIEKIIDPLVEETNMILASLGPKISALALYKYHQKHPKTAMAYAPSNEFSRDYSKGLKETIAGML